LFIPSTRAAVESNAKGFGSQVGEGRLVCLWRCMAQVFAIVNHFRINSRVVQGQRRRSMNINKNQLRSLKLAESYAMID
jgi:hypothetical protein